MLFQIKIYLIATLYFFGALFMLLFPPRNFDLSGIRYRSSLRNQNSTLQYHEYVTYQKLLDIVKSMPKYDALVATVRFLTPHTAENRSIVAFELHSDEKSKKPGILIIGGVNAMSWGSSNAIMELADKLLHDSSYQTPFFNDYDWYLIPMVNPDGLQFTQSVSHLKPINWDRWSKNVSIHNITRPLRWYKNVDREGIDTCFGTNINRNFAYHWMDDVHAPPDRCSQYYAGNHPFSTAETKALREYLSVIGERITLAIHLNPSYVLKKEYILYPWRFSHRQQSNYQTLQDIGEYAGRQSRLPDGRLYEVHQASNDEQVAGSLSDYLSGVVGTELVFILKPYFPPFPDLSDAEVLETYTKKSVSAILGLVRGWRSSSKQNTLYCFGREIEF